MKNIFRLFLSICFLFSAPLIYSQCEITATALPADITCGTCVTLTAFGEGQGNSVFTESFNSGAPTGWHSTAQATYSNPCDPSGVDGTTHLWMGDATGVPRQLTTTSFNFSAATAGATICFDMLFAEQGDASPCEGPDEPDEGVYLQYSINNGATWVTIHYFDPNGGNDASLINWNNWCFALPAAALTANTQIRWFQDNDSGADYDHWGLDNVNIYFNDPTFNITWQHDNYSYGVGNSGGPNPNQVCPQTTTTYTVTMTNGTTTCTDQVTVNVVPPVFRVDAGNDTTICAGQCLDLSGEATIIVSPAKTPTYSNSEVSALTGLPSAQDLANILIPCVNFSGCNCPNGSSVPFLGTCPAIFNGTLSMNINITDLNSTILQNGELTSICIGDALMIAGNLSPFQVSLTCPSGSSIILANAGDLNGTTLTNTCFDLTSTTPLSSASSPYNGTFQPVQSLSNLNGCASNGVWTLSFSGTFNLSSGTIPVGFLNGWDISFDDPEIIYTGIYSWSPTTNMSNATSLNPTVCPTSTQAYTLSVADSAGCASASDVINVTVTNNNCCPFEISYTSQQPACGLSNGSIDVSISNGSGNYSYSWSSGPTTQDLNNVGSGSYTITVTDIDLNCQKDTTIVLSSPNSPILNDTTVVATSCGLANGSVSLFVSGGTAPLSYSIGAGPTQASNVFSNLAGGTYTFNYSDANSCSNTIQITVPSSVAPSLDSVQLIQTTCGQNNGTINVFGTGNGVLAYSIDNGANFQASNVFSNLSVGNYNVVIRDANNCLSSSQLEVINPSSNPIIDNVLSTAPSCGASDGSIEILASGGQAPLSYSIDNGANFQASNLFSNLSSGVYTIVISDVNNCSANQNLSLNAANAPSIDNLVALDPSCADNDGSITISASGGQAPLSYSIDNGLNFQASNVFSNLPSGVYTVVVSDALSCESQAQISLNLPAGPSIDNVLVVDNSCGSLNGSISVSASGGSAPLSYSLDNGLNFQASGNFTNLVSASYTLVVQDANGCTSTQNVTISNVDGPSFSSIQLNNPSCGLNNGSLTIGLSGGTAPFEYSIDNGTSFQNSNSFTNLAAGNYILVVREVGNTTCFVDSSINLSNSAALVIDSSFVINETCLGEEDGALLFSLSSGTQPLTVLPTAGISASVDFPGFYEISNLAPNNYTFLISDANACDTSLSFTINAGLTLQLSTINDTSVLSGELIQLSTEVVGSTNGTYNWTPNLALSCNDCQSPIAYITDDIQYTVIYTDNDFNCVASDQVNISIEIESPYCLFPTAFSPNDDAVNDGYGPICESLSYLELKIYNRWGELIYKASGNSDLIRWDGKYKGKDASLDVYIYVANIEYLDGSAETLSGNFTLIR
ncbi:MAG: gliding motility-associated C-terminal domain-containing protein [Chitinophagales bacterium]